MDPLPAHRLDEADDRTLAGRAADGDIRSFEVILRRYGALMRVYAGRILGSTDEIDDVVQESFIVAWQRLPSLEESAAVKSWLLTIVTRRALDRVRARNRRAVTSIDEHEIDLPHAHSPAELVEAGSLNAALSVALSSLPDQQRQCWVLREVAGYSYDDIANELELPVSTVRGLLARARKTLIGEMEVWR